MKAGGSLCSVSLALVLGSCQPDARSDSKQYKNRILSERLEAIVVEQDAAAVLDLRGGRLLAVVNERRLGMNARPGSVLKLVGAAAMLRAGEEDRSVTCPGRTLVGGVQRECWDRRGHGEVRLHRAIVHSCNIYFYHLATRLDPDVFLSTMRGFGFGRTTGWGAGESPGMLPPSLSRSEMPDALLGMSDELFVTGFQLLRLIASLSGSGEFGTTVHPSDEDLRQALADAAVIGTAGPTVVDVPFAGKTGTTPRLGGWRPHGWFVGYAPAALPQYAVVVFSDTGVGADAAGLGQTVLAATYEVFGDSR